MVYYPLVSLEVRVDRLMVAFLQDFEFPFSLSLTGGGTGNGQLVNWWVHSRSRHVIYITHVVSCNFISILLLVQFYVRIVFS